MASGTGISIARSAGATENTIFGSRTVLVVNSKYVTGGKGLSVSDTDADVDLTELNDEASRSANGLSTMEFSLELYFKHIENLTLSGAGGTPIGTSVTRMDSNDIVMMKAQKIVYPFLLGLEDTALTSPGVSATGWICYAGNCRVKDYNWDANVGEVITGTANFMVTGPIVRTIPTRPIAT